MINKKSYNYAIRNDTKTNLYDKNSKKLKLKLFKK